MAITIVGIEVSGMGDYAGGALSCNVPAGTIDGDDIWLCDMFFVSSFGTLTYDLTTYDIVTDFESSGGGNFSQSAGNYVGLTVAHRIAAAEPGSYSFVYNSHTSTDARRAYCIVVTRNTGTGMSYSEIADIPYNTASPHVLTPSGAAELAFYIGLGWSTTMPAPTVSMSGAEAEASVADPSDIGTVHRFRLGVGAPPATVTVSYADTLGGGSEFSGALGVDITTPAVTNFDEWWDVLHGAPSSDPDLGGGTGGTGGSGGTGGTGGTGGSGGTGGTGGSGGTGGTGGSGPAGLDGMDGPSGPSGPPGSSTDGSRAFGFFT